MPQLARHDAIEVGEPVVRASSKIEACDQVEQALLGTTRDSQRFLVKSIDIAADEVTRQSVASPFLRLVAGQVLDFSLEYLEDPRSLETLALFSR